MLPVADGGGKPARLEHTQTVEPGGYRLALPCLADWPATDRRPGPVLELDGLAMEIEKPPARPAQLGGQSQLPDLQRRMVISPGSQQRLAAGQNCLGEVTLKLLLARRGQGLPVPERALVH